MGSSHRSFRYFLIGDILYISFCHRLYEFTPSDNDELKPIQKKLPSICYNRYISQIYAVSSINRKLIDTEKGIKKECLAIIGQLDKRINDADDWLDDYLIDCDLTFHLKEDDPDYADYSDNILFQLNQSIFPNSWEFGVGDGMDHNHVPWENCPIKGEHHCWSYHVLSDHAGLDWINILRIGSIRIDITVKYQKFIEL